MKGIGKNPYTIDRHIDVLDIVYQKLFGRAQISAHKSYGSFS